VQVTTVPERNGVKISQNVVKEIVKYRSSGPWSGQQYGIAASMPTIQSV
jgi:hypothetical protein